uniref:Uncharacterized protein n=1 Tax=Strongyloides papillosus TaxID=174720 RepID=A0A0N5C4E2_STREA
MELKNIKEQTSRELNKVMMELKKASDERDIFRNKYLLCNKTEKINNISSKATVNEKDLLLINNLKRKLSKYEENQKDDNKQLKIINGTLLETQVSLHIKICVMRIYNIIETP